MSNEIPMNDPAPGVTHIPIVHGSQDVYHDDLARFLHGSEDISHKHRWYYMLQALEAEEARRQANKVPESSQ